MASTQNYFPLGFHFLFNFKNKFFQFFCPAPLYYLKLFNATTCSLFFSFFKVKKIISNIYFSQHYYFKANCITRSFTSSNRFTFKFKLVFNHNISKPQTFRLLYNYWVFLSFLKMIVRNWDNWETREFKRDEGCSRISAYEGSSAFIASAFLTF
jgi:hypothetical protein